MTTRGAVHEPDAELLSAEDVIRDVERLERWDANRSSREVSLRLPFAALLDAVDGLRLEEAEQLLERAQRRLWTAKDSGRATVTGA